MPGSSATTGWLPLDGTANTRVVVPGVLLRSDNLQSLTPADVRRLVDAEGLEVVLDLRTELEAEREGPGPLSKETGVRHVHLSLHPRTGEATDVDAATARLWPPLSSDRWRDETRVVQSYMGYLAARPESVTGAVRTIAGAEKAVLVHCAAGKDRTGVVVALALGAADVPRARIVADYLATAERIEAIIDRLLQSPTYRAELEGHDPQTHAPQPGTMERVLELVDAEFGGAAAWLSAHGLSDADLDRLRDRIARSPRA